MKKFNIAVVGATGLVGQEMIKTLEQRKFPVGQLFALASGREPGRTIEFRGETLPVENLAAFDFGRTELALFSAGGSVSAEYAPKSAAAGCVVIDNSSHFRYEDDIPLVVPEVNASAIADYTARHIIANPNCSTIQLVVALKPLHDVASIRQIHVATYQSVSGAGHSAVEALAKQSAAALSGQPIDDNDVFPARMAFNVVPHIDTFEENGYTREEMKIVWETHKIFDDRTIAINPTAVRVPVFFGHAEAVYIETAEPLGAEAAREILSKAPGVCVIDEHIGGGYPTPVEQAAGNDEVFVGRIRDDLSSAFGLNLWVVSDNVRKGAALNAVQIAEHLVVHYL